VRHNKRDRHYPEIGAYAIIGDARSISLISRQGSIDWWCLPRFDGDPVFSRLLDAEKGGYFSVSPAIPFRAERRYLDDTNILETTFTTASGSVRTIDFMPALTEAQKNDLSLPFREIIRRVEVLSGQVPIAVTLSPRPRFGTVDLEIKQPLPNHYAILWGVHALHLATSHPLTIGSTPPAATGTLSGVITLEPGTRLDLALSYSDQAPAYLPVLSTLDQIQELTTRFWHGWSAVCTYTGPYREAVLRSALALKLLTYAPSGAIIAAPTTSLPEVIGGVRNWDYRYCWLRDAAFTVRALLLLGYRKEAHAFAEWLLHATRLTHPELSILYNVFGETRIPEYTIEGLDGYRGSRPVRVGNAAHQQFQLDVYGEVVGALALYRRSGGKFDSDARNLLRGIAHVIMERWHEPDDGIWEGRSGRAQHIHSKVMAWVGLDLIIELAQNFDRIKISTEKARATANAIHAWVTDIGYNTRVRAFTRTPDSTDLDAALLVIPLVRFLPPDDPRLVSTVEAIQHRLAENELVFRYRGEDGLPGQEGAFLICSFWLVEALFRMGRQDEAHALFTRLLDRRNDVGLLSEEIDPASGALLGNFPQAFSHIGLINAALTLSEEVGAEIQE
jgi:GH15 family glucan-1,4-alpha-glucosidase